MGRALIYFIAATYNEQDEIDDLVYSVYDLVDGYRIADDGSTDKTREILWSIETNESFNKDFHFVNIGHTGLPETVKNEALKMVPDGSWVLMLDADERLTYEAKYHIKNFFYYGEDQNWDYVYFDQIEIIDGQQVRAFNKCKLFRKENIKFPLNNIHADDEFTGRGTSRNWAVLHRKSTAKQINREMEYLETYDRLLEEGHIDEGRRDWLRGLHHYVTKPQGADKT